MVKNTVSGEPPVHELTLSNEMAISGPVRAKSGSIESASGRTKVAVEVDKLGKGIVQVWRDGRVMHTHSFAREDNIDQ